MERNEVRFECLSDHSVRAFESTFSLPSEVSRSRVIKLNTTPPAAIQIILDSATWLTIAGLKIGAVAWLSKRVGVFVDEFSKGFAGEAGKDLYGALKSLLQGFRTENPKAGVVADSLEEAWSAVEEAEGRQVRLILGIPLGQGLEDNVRVHLSSGIESSEFVLAFLAMQEGISKNALLIAETHQLAFPEIIAEIRPYGYLLQWIEEPCQRMWQGFAPDGTKLSDASSVPDETREEIIALRQNWVEELPAELRQAALDAYEKHDREQGL